jgi:hypothetical protein
MLSAVTWELSAFSVLLIRLIFASIGIAIISFINVPHRAAQATPAHGGHWYAEPESNRLAAVCPLDPERER